MAITSRPLVLINNKRLRYHEIQINEMVSETEFIDMDIATRQGRAVSLFEGRRTWEIEAVYRAGIVMETRTIITNRLIVSLGRSGRPRFQFFTDAH